MPPAASIGYLPNFDSRKSRISGSRASACFVESGTPGANALTIGVPSLRFWRSNVHLSIATVVMYGTIGVSSAQTCVVPPGALNDGLSRPFAITPHSSGTVIARWNVALSSGVSLTGYQVVADFGSPATNAPPARANCQPLLPSAGSLIGAGTP